MVGENTPHTVLLIDDNEEFVAKQSDFLKSQGYQVIVAKDGHQGWEMFLQTPVHVVVLDLVMPEKDGIWFLDQVKADPKFVDTPIIVLTNLSHGEKIGKAVVKGVSRLLIKQDTTPNELAHYIKEVIISQG